MIYLNKNFKGAYGKLIDGYSRKISYLRMSVTDRCNLRCLLHAC